MPEPIRVTPQVLIPAAALSFRAVRASGPGGQNVNKVASRVELRVDLSRIQGLASDARQRLDAFTARRRGTDGLLVITSQRTRDQFRNLEDARAKLRELVVRSLAAPRRRRPTRPSVAARERRLFEKQRRAGTKQGRGRVQAVD